MSSYEKFVMDADQLGTLHHLAQGIHMDVNGQAMDAIREVGPGGHFFGAAHTLARYESAFYAPMVSDWRNYQQWAAAGSPDAYSRANKLYKQALSEYQMPHMDIAINESLDDFVNRRLAEGGVPTDF